MSREILDRLDKLSGRHLRKLLREVRRKPFIIQEQDTFLSKVLEKTKEEDTQTKLAALSLTKFFMAHNPNLAEKIGNSLMNYLNDEKANVKAVAIEIIAKHFDDESIKRLDIDLKEVASSAIGSGNSFLAASGLDLLSRLEKLGQVDLRDFSSELFDIYKRETNYELLRRLGRLLLDVFDSFVEDEKEEFMQSTKLKARHPSPLVRSFSVKLLSNLVANKDIELKDSIKFVRKLLRDRSDIVKREALELGKILLKKDLRKAHILLDVIVKEILLGKTSKRTKIRALKVIDETIDHLPDNVINRYMIPRALDILETNTAPKSPVNREIKNLSRKILEEKLGLTLEKRIRLKREF